MKDLLQQGLNYWMQLRPREQLLLSLAGLVLLLALLFLLVWEPVMQEHRRLQQNLVQQQQLLAWMQQSAAEVRRLQGGKGQQRQDRARAGQSLLALIDSTAKRARLGAALKRVEPDGAGRVRVWLEQAAFDDLVRWLGQLQQRYGVRVDSIAVDRDDKPGRVAARVVFAGSAT